MFSSKYRTGIERYQADKFTRKKGVTQKLKLGGLCKEKGGAMDGGRYGLQQSSWENSSVRLT